MSDLTTLYASQAVEVTSEFQAQLIVGALASPMMAVTPTHVIFLVVTNTPRAAFAKIPREMMRRVVKAQIQKDMVAAAAAASPDASQVPQQTEENTQPHENADAA